VNDPDQIPSGSSPEAHKHQAGFEAQADALSTLRSGLDQYADRMDAAIAAREKASKSAAATRDRLITEADQKLESTLKSIEQNRSEAHAKIQNKYTGRLEAVQREHNSRTFEIQGVHKRGVGSAKKAREERLWMADTIHESSLRKETSHYKTIQLEFAEQAQQIQDLGTQLAMTLGSSKAAMVTQASDTDQSTPDDPTQDGLDSLIRRISDAILELTGGGIKKLFRGRTKTLELGIGANNLIIEAQAYHQSLSTKTTQQHEQRLAEIDEARSQEIEKADQKCHEATQAIDEKACELTRIEHEQFNAQSSEIRSRMDRETVELEAWHKKQTEIARKKHDAKHESARINFTESSEESSTNYDTKLADARTQILQSTTTAMHLIKTTHDQTLLTNPDWQRAAESEHPTGVPGVITLANARLDLRPRLERISEGMQAELELPKAIEIPVVWSLPGRRSLMITHDAESREQTLATMRNLILRILASFPAGKARFLLADPIGIGQSFAEFMTLSDQEPSPVGQRIWSDPQQIERQLADITEHMQTVIQKYLRADYETIEDYNRAAGEISEPYRFVVIADLPEALSETGASRLKSILESGPRCGVYTILSSTAGEKLPPNIDPETIRSNTMALSIKTEGPELLDDRFDETVIELLPEPDDRVAALLLERIARASAQAGTVEVPFQRLAPDDDKIWSRSCNDEIVIPIGRSGAHKNQELRLGSGTRQHALIAGRTGSGKSTLLHVIISAAMLWHSPDELEFYLIDFKKGVEFKAYTGSGVPHVRAVAIESDREFGLSVLKRLDDHLTSRGELFRKLGAQNLASARSLAPSERLPRLLLLIDEFQEFFTTDDGVASEAALLLDRLVRQGRAFGVHVILGSQTLAGSYSLARSTLGQIGVRIALQCSEADSYLILAEDNTAARLLERPGEAIYNNAGGLVEGNSPFQTAWLPDAERDENLARMPRAAADLPATVVFEGNRPARFDVSTESFVHAYPDRRLPRALLGDAVAIAPPTSVPLLKRSGSNLLIIGQQPEPCLGMLVSAAITAGSAQGARLVVVDPTPEDDAIHGRIANAIHASGINAQIVTQQRADRVVEELSQIVQDRNEVAGDPIILVLAGFHRLRSLRKSDDFSFSMDESKPTPDKALNNILREGPAVGVWTLAWCDTLTNTERSIERSTLREYGLRVLMQMSASDSASLIDSSVASTLGANRAILADDVEGTHQKFRPINLPDADTVRRAAGFLMPKSH